jgi:isoquinoline 1-oxidoreductase beta subunit
MWKGISDAMKTNGMAPTRRAFTFGISAAAGGVILAPHPISSIAAQLTAPSDEPRGDSEITAWIVIEPDDTTIIRVARSEMGQGNFTALPMLVAEELECDWRFVHPEYIEPSENIARDHAWGDMTTAASLSVRGSQSYLRKAGAQARHMLIEEAAERWHVPPGECSARDSVVTHGATGRTIRYGQIAKAAARRSIPADVPLKSAEDWRLIGRPARRVDVSDKALGKPIYASDVRLPDMLYATVSACPVFGGRLKSFDASKVMNMPGVRYVVPVEGTAVAVVADSWWQAKLACDALPVTWDPAAGKGLSTETIRETFFRGLEADDVAIGRKIGDVDNALSGGTTIVRADYEVPYLAHTTMEPMTCTAHVTGGRAEVWAPTQNGEGTLRNVAAALEIDPSKVIVHKHHLGGGFGRRGLAQDWARMAVLIAKQVDRPVKMIWTREEDVQHDYYRPMVLARQVAGFDAAGNLVGWRARVCGSSILVGLSPDRLKDGQDIEMMNAFLDEDMAYDVPNFEVGYVMRNTPVPVGFWRGVNHSQNGYFRESFVDELAHARGQDPYLFRRALLSKGPRSLAVLDEAARRANWGRAPEGIFQGIALVECYNSATAQVVDISVSDTGELAVHRVIVVIDAGYIVNPNIVEAQMEGAVVYGLGAVLYGQITLHDGQVQQSNFHDYRALRMNEMPKVETYLLSSGSRYSQEWGGVGEPGTPPLAPAIANAVFAATGRRIRSLPLANNEFKHGHGR